MSAWQKGPLCAQRGPSRPSPGGAGRGHHDRCGQLCPTARAILVLAGAGRAGNTTPSDGGTPGALSPAPGQLSAPLTPKPPRRLSAHGSPVLTGRGAAADLARGRRGGRDPQGVFGEVRTARTGMTAALRPPGPPRPGLHLLPAVIFRRQLLGRVLPRPGDKGQAQHGHAPGAPESTEHCGWGWPPGPGLWAKRPRSWGAGVLSVLSRHAQPCLHPATLCHTPSGPSLAGQGGWRPLPARSPVGSPRSTGRETFVSPGRGGCPPVPTGWASMD